MARRSYDDKFRASAVVMLEAAGYPGKKGALERTAKHLGVPAMTLSRWAKGSNNPPPNEIVTEKKGELIDWINGELEAVFGVLPSKRTEASYRDLMTGVGILIDKRQLLTGKPTESIEYKDTGLTDEERTNRISQLLNRAGERRIRSTTIDGESV